MSVCCRVLSKTCGNVVWVWLCAVTAVQDVWEYRFTLHSADFMHTVCIRLCVQMCENVDCWNCIAKIVYMCVFPRVSDGALQHTDMILYSHASWTAVCTLGVSQSCDLQFYTHVCLSMLTQPSKTCGNIKHDFIHISVGIVGRRPRRMRTHMCTKLYVCEFIFPRVLDGCVSMLRHTCI